MTNWKFFLAKWSVIIAVLAFIVWRVYVWIKKQGGFVKYPNNGQGIPAGWSPVPFADRLYNAMDGFGTDENEIWAVLEGANLTDDMKAAVYNQYYKKYGKKLEDEFRSELSGYDYTRALNSIKNILQ